MSVPKDLLYTKSHEWVRDNGDGTATLGISTYAQDQLGDVVFWDGPAAGDTFEAGDTLGVVESVKAVSDVYSPVAGEIVENNPALEDAPESVNEDPFGSGWMVKIKLSSALDGFLSPDEYEALLAEL